MLQKILCIRPSIYLFISLFFIAVHFRCCLFKKKSAVITSYIIYIIYINFLILCKNETFRFLHLISAKRPQSDHISLSYDCPRPENRSDSCWWHPLILSKYLLFSFCQLIQQNVVYSLSGVGIVWNIPFLNYLWVTVIGLIKMYTRHRECLIILPVRRVSCWERKTRGC